jgi:hypothetical protein
MAFLNPLLLLGVTGVSIPIVIHLMNKRKFERVVWAAMRFLRISVEQNQRRMRLEDLFLLLLRCALILLLALALARPAMPAAAGGLFGQAKVDAVILLDASGSMTQTDGVQSRFERGKRAAELVIDALPPGSCAAVYLATDAALGLVPEPTYDLHLARKMVREARCTDRASNHFPALAKGLEVLAGRASVRKEVYLITDRQALGWRQMADLRKALQAAREEVKAHVIFVGGGEDRNLGVSDLRLASGLSPVQHPLRFEVQVTNYGSKDAENVHVTLRVDNDPPIEETDIPRVEAGKSRSISLFAKLRSDGYHTVTAQIAPDRVPSDDARTVALRGIQAVKVLLVDGEPGRESRDSEVFYLRHALQPVPSAETEQFFIRTATVTPAQIEGLKLDDYDAVVLANVTDFGTRTLRDLEAYLRRGGGLLIFLGASVNPTFYNERLLGRHAFLPAALGAARGEADQTERCVSLQAPPYEHPLTAIWNDPMAGSLTTAKFFRFYELKPAIAPAEGGTEKASAPAAEAGPPKVVARFADGTPAIMERTWGLGRVILFSSTADTAWNNLPMHPAFVPLIHRALGSIVQRQDEGLNVRVGQKFVFRAPAELLGRDARVMRPGQKDDAARDSRRVELAAGWPLLQFEETDAGGAYEVSVAGDPPTTIRFAAQPDPRESSLEEIAAARETELGQSANVIAWTPGAALEGAIQKERVGTEYWRPLAILALLLAAAETWLAHWFSQSK